MDFQMSINPLISFPIKKIYCIILIFVIFYSHNKLSMAFSSAGFYTKGRPLVKSNLNCPLDKLSWQPGCPILNINTQGNFCISQGNGTSDKLPENLM